jgi:hypothetical protein
VDTGDDLKLNIRVDIYGFFVPTTVLGIKAGAYQFQIIGYVEARDAKKKGKKVAFAKNVISQVPMGSKPAKELVPEAIAQCVQKFAAAVKSSLINERCK